MISQIRQLKSVSPPVNEINRIIYETVYDTRRRFHILGWVEDRLTASDDKFSDQILDYFASRALEACKDLRALMLEKTYVFTKRKYRLCWRVIDYLNEFAHLKHKSERYLQDRLFVNSDSHWLEAFENFEGNGWWNRWPRHYFDGNLEDAYVRIEVITEITKVFPMMQALDAELLVRLVAK